ncbi:hypothetical protein RRG08_034794 [Elysia crispata]|uniref:Uncharacterized protein n=1 Tax=Elysia crispata TaxID=231223 RepID=A0AAE0YB13_9GAST|nr:hypothetical protein RRG08_034794 [Elysia crispata]
MNSSELQSSVAFTFPSEEDESQHKSKAKANKPVASCLRANVQLPERLLTPTETSRTPGRHCLQRASSSRHARLFLGLSMDFSRCPGPLFTYSGLSGHDRVVHPCPTNYGVPGTHIPGKWVSRI